jgi:DNA-directed RNA polymerase specialized sigma24 family protein
VSEPTAAPERQWPDRQWDQRLVDELRDLYEPLRRFAAIVGRNLEPDDLVQEAFARVLVVDPGRIDDTGRYVRRIIANLAHNERRRAERGARALSRIGTAAPSVDDYPSELADLMFLEPRVRGLVYLVDIEGATVADAADQVGLPAANARMALTRARRRLRRVLHDRTDHDRDRDDREETER